MQYGNCMLGLLILIIKHRFKGKIVLLKQRNSILPHLCWLARDGVLHDYHIVKDVLPKQLSFLWFKGKFRSRVFRHINFYTLGC